MTVLLVALLLASLLLALALLLSVAHRYRAALRRPAARRALGGGQLLVGLLWLLWGAIYLGQHGRGAGAGWYAVVLGALWAVQAVRRLT